MSRGKLFDDLSPDQFNALMKVLSSLSVERDFRHLLMIVNLQEVLDLQEAFFLPKFPHQNFKGLGSAQAKKRVLSHLLRRIKEAFEDISGGDASDTFPLPSLSHLSS